MSAELCPQCVSGLLQIQVLVAREIKADID